MYCYKCGRNLGEGTFCESCQVVVPNGAGNGMPALITAVEEKAVAAFRQKLRKRLNHLRSLLQMVEDGELESVDELLDLERPQVRSVKTAAANGSTEIIDKRTAVLTEEEPVKISDEPASLGCYIYSMALMKGGLACAATETGFIVMDMRERKIVKREMDHVPVFALASSGGSIFCGSIGGDVMQYDLQKGFTKVCSFSKKITALCVLGSGETIIAGFEDGEIAVVKKGKPVADIECHAGRVHNIKATADGAFIATSGEDNKIKLFRSGTFRELVTFNTSEEGVMGLAFSPDAQMIACGTKSGKIELFNLNNFERVGEMDAGGAGGVFSLIFTPDGARIVSGHSSGAINVWDSSTLECASTASKGKSPISEIAIESGKMTVATLNGNIYQSLLSD